MREPGGGGDPAFFFFVNSYRLQLAVSSPARGVASVSYVEWFLRALAASIALVTLAMVRLMAFMLLGIGIQNIWTGWAELNGLA